MAVDFEVVIIGAGPGGLSAAARAATRGMNHILLERSDHLADTLFKYQRGKLVMAQPDILPLRSEIPFAMGHREEILDHWAEASATAKVNVRHNAQVSGIAGSKGEFSISMADGSTITAGHVVLAIGLQGNLRKLGVPGDDLPLVQYQLDDPKEYNGETIVVVGGGDAAIENAVALSEQNNVILLVREGEFARAKQGNVALITHAIETGVIECLFLTVSVKVREGGVRVKSASDERWIECNRIIARLGADPPRRFVEACGIKFPSTDPSSLPELSSTYESNVPGLYVVGALAGYPLIKQALNQGYEVIETILGTPVEPADQGLLAEKFSKIGNVSVDEMLVKLREQVPLLSDLTILQLREFLLESDIHTPKPGEVVFERNAYTNSFYSIVDGEVAVQIDPTNPKETVTLGQGSFFGEMGLISGRRRTATVLAGKNCILLETPRRSMLKLMASVAAVREKMNKAAIIRQVQSMMPADLDDEEMHAVIESASSVSLRPGEALFSEGDPSDALYLIKSGSVTVSRSFSDREVVLSYLSAGKAVGEMGLLDPGAKRSATVRAATATQALRIEAAPVLGLFEHNPALRLKFQTLMQSRLSANARREVESEDSSVIEFLLKQGLGEATDILLIDEALCVRCDNCEKACADNHQGISRLDREAGPTYATLHLPTSCRHCENPHCMSDCPPDAISRSPNGEVFIADNCIGCGNCQRNCPYGVIKMSTETPPKRNLLMQLLFGDPPPPKVDPHKGAGHKVAVKCDLCKGIKGGAACVRACPTGAAIRVSPEDLLTITKATRSSTMPHG